MRRFDEYAAVLRVLSRAGEQDLDNEFVQSGIVDKFSLQFELGWKMLKDLLRYEGDATGATGSPRDALKAANRLFDFVDEEAWLEMLRERNTIAHLYDESKMTELIERILSRYIPAFQKLEAAVASRYGETLGTIA